jgi:hypothetical protein
VDQRMDDRHPRRQGAVETLDLLLGQGAPRHDAQGLETER